MKRLIALFVICLQSFAVADDRAVLAIQGQACVDGQTCVIARGSGVAVGRTPQGKLVILTAAHVVRDTSNVTVYVGNNWRPANVRVVTSPNPNWDLALVEVDYVQPWPCVQLVRDVLGVENTTVSVAGYANGVTWQHRRGLLGRETDKYWLWWNDAPPVEGTSGGAVTVNGELAGIISGRATDGSGQGVGQSPQAIKLFLDTCYRRRGITIVYPGVQPTPQTTIPNPAKGPQPGDSIPNPAPGPQPSQDIAKLKEDIAKLQVELNAVRDRGVTVEIRDPETKQVKARTFAPGEPIRLQLPARQP